MTLGLKKKSMQSSRYSTKTSAIGLPNIDSDVGIFGIIHGYPWVNQVFLRGFKYSIQSIGPYIQVINSHTYTQVNPMLIECSSSSSAITQPQPLR